MKKKPTYVVLLAGGSGQRLWPLSTEKKPKQFLSISGKQTMLEDTLDRVENITSESHIWCITNKKFKKEIEKNGGSRIHNIIYEPEARNTAPAILTACLEIYKIHPESTILFLPTDHYIPDLNIFRSDVQKALDQASSTNDIVLLGIKPTYAATGYGYIKYKNEQSNAQAFPVEGFYEKPDSKTASTYLKSATMLWNAGMFCASTDTFIENFKQHAPELLNSAVEYLDGRKKYNDLASISFDYAVLEKSNNLKVIPATFNWSDVGDLVTFLKLKNQHPQRVISVNAQKNIIHSNKRIIALAGVKNLCIIETKDTLLIIPKKSIQEVKKFPGLIKIKKLSVTIL